MKTETIAAPLTDRVSLKEKIAYSLGDSASNFYWKTFEFFIVFFYTDVFGLPAAAVGMMMLVTRLVDAVSDPIMGTIADRTSTRWGRFRPYLIWGAIPFGAAGVLTFTTPHLGGGAKLVYAYITYTLLMISYTVVNIPYSALMGVITPNSQERTSIASIRFIGAFTVGIVVQYFTLPLVTFLGHGSKTRGWQLTMALYGMLAVVLLVLCFLGTRERVLPPPQQSEDLGRDILNLFGNRPWIVLVGVVLLALAAFAIKGSDGIYYFKYFVKREDLLSLFLVSNGLSFLAAVSVAPPLARLLGKKALFMIALGAGGAVLGFFWFLRPADILWMFVLQIVSSFILGFNSPLIFAMFADAADHAEWQTGRRNTGLIFASAIFATKVGWALGAWLLGVTLTFFGYVANTGQSSRSLIGIVLSSSWIPCVLLVLGAALMIFYPLSEAMMVKIEADLKERRGEIGE